MATMDARLHLPRPRRALRRRFIPSPMETGKAQGTDRQPLLIMRSIPCVLASFHCCWRLGVWGDRCGLVVASILDSWSILTVRGSRATWTSRRKHRVFATPDNQNRRRHWELLVIERTCDRIIWLAISEESVANLQLLVSWKLARHSGCATVRVKARTCLCDDRSPPNPVPDDRTKQLETSDWSSVDVATRWIATTHTLTPALISYR
ncbi:hypothetical protein ZEAMMB73_Zm00001d027404 [Zea mays]|uniref:Uncharacterized protein n=1 Tax=Zea mays TaxID=4577 RepID=A0A1D6JLS2_MAIZE|nr:hypothetical protein ZEAMMB73_Zm00001d027404 [Zea mays]